MQFDGPVPPYTVTPQPAAVFLQDASGRPQPLEGTAGVRIRVSPASGAASYSGPIDFKPGYPVLREARQIGDFEAVTTWGLGLSRPACLRIFTLSSPPRLVIDVAT